MNLDAARQAFMEEAGELLGVMEDILLSVEDANTDEEQLGALFRTMHTIKGSAGLFGFDEIVHFAHETENVLDKLRAGAFPLSQDLAGVLLRCHDHVKAMLAVIDDPAALQALAEPPLLDELRQCQQNGGRIAAAAPGAVEPAAPAGDEAGVEQCWAMSLRFSIDVLRNGMDPGSFLRYLVQQGRVEGIVPVLTRLPSGAAFDPESNYLRFELLFRTACSLQQLQDVFEFVQDGSQILIFPQADVAQYWPAVIAAGDAAEQQAVVAAWQQLGLLLPDSHMPDAPPPAAVEPGPPMEPAPVPVTGSATHPAPVPVTGSATHPAPVPVTGSATHPALVATGTAAAVASAVGAQLAPPPAKAAAAAEARNPRSSESKFIRVEAGKLDSLINLIGELVIAGAAANLMARRSGHGGMVESTQSIANLIEQIRTGTLSMRMVQIGDIFGRFPRVVRDVSKELGKNIELHVLGAETELDKSMVDKLADPLTHIVRNAIDHGIEPQEARLAAGKPEVGGVWLNAYHESGSVVIEVADDGGGLNKDKILAKAVAKGLVAADSNLADADIYKLIFEAGFSTAEQVTNLSGRGVGMDVVRRSIEQLRGTIEIDSELGAGTTFRIRLPLTLAIIDGFLVGIGSATFVVPLEAVIECIELPADGLPSGAHTCLNLRGEVLPMLDLNAFLELGQERGKRRNVVVVRYGENKAGLIVDELQGEFQTVIKPLGTLFRNLRAISGSTILGSGEVALILDIPALIQFATAQEAEKLASRAEGAGRIGQGHH